MLSSFDWLRRSRTGAELLATLQYLTAEPDLFPTQHALGTYVHDERHFLLLMRRYELKTWLRELVIYHGADLKGLVQIFPTTAARQGASMGEILCRAVHLEARFSMDRLRVRFFSAPYQLLTPRTRDREGLLTLVDYVAFYQTH